MEAFANIIKQFTQDQRLVVLLLLLVFTSSTYVVTQSMKTESCRSLIDENLALQNDFAAISKLIREATLAQYKVSSSPDFVANDTVMHINIEYPLDEISMKILEITEKHTPK